MEENRPVSKSEHFLWAGSPLGKIRLPLSSPRARIKKAGRSPLVRAPACFSAALSPRRSIKETDKDTSHGIPPPPFAMLAEHGGSGSTTPPRSEDPGGERRAEAKERVCRDWQAGLPSRCSAPSLASASGSPAEQGRLLCRQPLPAPPPGPSAESPPFAAAAPPKPSPLGRRKGPDGSPSRPSLRAAAWRAASPAEAPAQPRRAAPGTHPARRSARGPPSPLPWGPARRCCRRGVP